MSRNVKAIGINNKDEKLHQVVIQRREPTVDDVVINIRYVGICHSDIHTIRGDWGPIQYPAVVGHEIIGTVEMIGSMVTKFQVGDTVGVGCFVDSCRTCDNCRLSQQQYCVTGPVETYYSKFKYSHSTEYGNDTYGGYSESIVVQQDYVLRIPKGVDLAATAPLLCAGITTYSPLKYFGLKAGQKLAILGMGGLGHMGVKFGKAFGAHTTVISRGIHKRETALAMGADAFIDSTNPEEMKSAVNTFDFILNTISGAHDIQSAVNTLRFDGTMIIVGAGRDNMTFRFGSLIGKRRRIVGSLIGGINETQEMLDFCSKHGIVCDIELINANYVNEAYERTLKGDVKYRFVIDMNTIDTL